MPGIALATLGSTSLFAPRAIIGEDRDLDGFCPKAFRQIYDDSLAFVLASPQPLVAAIGALLGATFLMPVDSVRLVTMTARVSRLGARFLGTFLAAFFAGLPVFLFANTMR